MPATSSQSMKQVFMDIRRNVKVDKMLVRVSSERLMFLQFPSCVQGVQGDGGSLFSQTIHKIVSAFRLRFVWRERRLGLKEIKYFEV